MCLGAGWGSGAGSYLSAGWVSSADQRVPADSTTWHLMQVALPISCNWFFRALLAGTLCVGHVIGPVSTSARQLHAAHTNPCIQLHPEGDDDAHHTRTSTRGASGFDGTGGRDVSACAPRGRRPLGFLNSGPCSTGCRTLAQREAHAAKPHAGPPCVVAIRPCAAAQGLTDSSASLFPRRTLLRAPGRIR